MKTYTPNLDAAVLERLREYAALFAPDFPQAKPARWAGVYLHGLLTDGDRKSIEPLSHRVPLPAGLTSTDPEQALQQFVSQSPWDHEAVLRRYRAQVGATFAHPDAVFVIDDTTFPKQGRHSVGVQRQYCGALGKKANCQAAVSIHYAAPMGHYPLALRLFLPESWVADAGRLKRAGVPQEHRRERTKGQIALDLLDRVRGEGLPGRVVLADAGYGVSGDFRQALADRGLHYIVGVTDEAVVFTTPPVWDRPAGRGRVGPAGGRPQSNPQLRPDSPRPVRLRDVAARTPLRRVTWRVGTKGRMSGRFAWVRVWPGVGWKRGACAGSDPVWLLIEEQADGVKYAFSNLPTGTSRLRAVRLWKSRWHVEQGYQQMKEELGLDHFEGRSWRGFHHHAAMVMLAYGFLLLERERARVERERAADGPSPRKKGSPSRR
ncbi:transposase : Transposase IS4 family protein OS=Methylobacterium oryzae CBMB20 GN=MOC_1p0068 PE=4 SV=1: DDE_5 [Gemmata massiliana]|uniref:Transposase IS701-like DDE domain-containing protein n=1 Tax=Gemmata massiliana TaxID=1210884 RepID=A0A6P2CW12_9BACT|nr:IS701 family transposase [Gemmata massiliana]VTR93328.1 transposase : Transposase IS4 family protein OS=Methylobacterium oryzae CBMB20 GN=MOC_1p0068 PE=4 SV=1: DDE_5 [Gemmata massiliana]